MEGTYTRRGHTHRGTCVEGTCIRRRSAHKGSYTRRDIHMDGYTRMSILPEEHTQRRETYGVEFTWRNIRTEVLTHGVIYAQRDIHTEGTYAMNRLCGCCCFELITPRPIYPMCPACLSPSSGNFRAALPLLLKWVDRPTQIAIVY